MRAPILRLLLALPAAGCGASPREPGPAPAEDTADSGPAAGDSADPAPLDADGDGSAAPEDCDDGDPGAYPGAPETPYDAIDQDCDGADLSDVDADGYPAAASGGGDCDDEDGAVHPGAAEICDNGADDDCDGAAPGCAFGGAGDVADLAATWSASAADVVGVGIAFALLGDQDGDGAGDLAAAGWSEPAGLSSDTFWILSGPLSGAIDLADATATITTWGDGGASLGYPALARAGDLDGDGLEDAAISAAYGEQPSQGGDVGVWRGPLLAGDLAFADADGHVVGDVRFGGMGAEIAAADIDGDGRSDLVAAEPGADRALVLLGPIDGRRGAADAAASLLAAEGSAPSSVAALGDRDGDGLPEVAVGACCVLDGAEAFGRVWVTSGPAAGAIDLAGADTVISSEDPADGFGADLANAGDVDGDSRDDLVVGARDSNAGGVYAGAIVVFTDLAPGAMGMDDAALQAWSMDPYSNFGWAVDGGPDVTGDATDDVVAGWGLSVFAGRGM